MAVDHQVTVVGEGLALGEPDGLPGGVVDGFGGDHQRVQRDQRAVVAVEVARVALGGTHDDLGTDRAMGGLDLSGVDAQRGGLFDDDAAVVLDCIAETADEPGRVQRRGVREVHRTEHRRRPDAVGRLGGVEHAEIVVGEAELPLMVGDLGSLAGELRGVAGQAHRAALGVVAVDPFVRSDAADLVDRVVCGAQHVAGRVVR